MKTNYTTQPDKAYDKPGEWGTILYTFDSITSVTPALNAFVEEKLSETSFEIHVGFNRDVSPGQIMNQGDNMTEDQNISIGIDGEGVSSHQFQVMVNDQAIEPDASPLYYTLEWGVSQGLPSEGTVIVMVDGSMWGSVYFEGARP